MVKNLRMLRESRKLSQEKLALLADFLEVTIDFLVGRDTAAASLPDGSSLQLSRFGERIRQSRKARGLKHK